MLRLKSLGIGSGVMNSISSELFLDVLYQNKSSHGMFEIMRQQHIGLGQEFNGALHSDVWHGY